MKTTTLLLFAVTILTISTKVFSNDAVPQGKPGNHGSSKKMTCPIEIIPSVGFGSIQVGRNIEEIKSLGMDIKEVEGTNSYKVTRQYNLGTDNKGNIIYVEAEIGELPNCIYFEKQQIRRKSSAKQLAKIFRGCGKEEMLFGGNVIKCDGIYITTGGSGGRQKTPSLKVLKL